MGNILVFPNRKRTATDIRIINLLTRALVLNNRFLCAALERKAFSKDKEEQSTVISLIEANAVLLEEAGRLK